MIAVYIRTSTEEQTPELQIRDCESINKYGVYELFTDKQSAWKDNKEREDFERLKKEIKKGNVAHLIIWDLDRIYRNRKNLIEFFQFCKIYNCKIHSVRQQWLETLNQIQPPFNEIMYDLMLQIMGWLAEEESNKKSQRVKMAVRKEIGKPTKSYKGNKWGRKTLSTFKKNKIKEFIKQNPKASLREIARNVETSKSSVHKYLLELNKEKEI